MDPDANLREQTELVAQIRKSWDDGLPMFRQDVSRLADLVEAMNGWIINGGHLPTVWQPRQVTL